MKTIFTISAVAVFLVVAPSPCFALEDIEFVTKERAKSLGLEINSSAAGPDAVLVVLEFETKGELKDYSRVALEMEDEGKLLLSSTLREEKSPSGRVIVSFAADRTKLDKLTLKVVVQYSERGDRPRAPGQGIR
ncbi:MAG TPA: hypothetical protein VMP01_23810 [Pirellulaceae bacterium]|nr:hypothetical protein [Pirellulaceae bacterium]